MLLVSVPLDVKSYRWQSRPLAAALATPESPTLSCRTGVMTPIVAMTANASDRDRDDCKRAGMNGFISKPVLRNTLSTTLLTILNHGLAWDD